MKIRFKTQPYQTTAVEAVADCFVGQPRTAAQGYRIDPGRRTAAQLADAQQRIAAVDELTGERNRELALPGGLDAVLKNVREVQRRQNLTASEALATTASCRINLDVEMETGTGKTYVYLKTMHELFQRYGWSKFIVMVPSVAIREGVAQAFDLTQEHFQETYGRKIRAFTYDSRKLSELEAFSSGGGIHAMVINAQAFNATGKDQRRIYDELDSFQSRKPIDVIAANRPILILDEPQKMEGKKTAAALAKFNPLFALRYSATHRTTHDKVHRLDAVDAYEQKLVKRIAVRGIEVKGLGGTNGYLYLERVEVQPKGKGGPVATLELEVKQKSGVKRIRRRVRTGDDLFQLSDEMEQYRDRHTVAEIDARSDTLTLANGTELRAGEVHGDVNEALLRRLQVRECVRAHLEREQALFGRGVKVLTLFFIDEVAKYRGYDGAGERVDGELARVFEEEYAQLRDETLGLFAETDEPYAAHLRGIEPGATHAGYFSIDKRKKTAGRLIDPQVTARGEFAGQSSDVDAYDLILKDKARLLSFEEPVRFLFSHSALREGWDNPNVFVIGTLKHSNHEVTRRQEVGRGLRIAVDRNGERLDDPAEVHAVNVLTVVASESYRDFVDALQGEMAAALAASGRPTKADEAFFEGKRMPGANGAEVTIDGPMARQIYRWLLKNDYVTDADELAPAYHAAKDAGTLAKLPESLQPHAEGVLGLIDGVVNPKLLPLPEDGRRPKTNPVSENLHKKEFLALWKKINRKAAYTVRFESDELIENCVRALDQDLHVKALQFVVQHGVQAESTTPEAISRGEAFSLKESRTRKEERSVGSTVVYDLLNELARPTGLTRRTIARILSGVEPSTYAQFPVNPEDFLAQASKLIVQQKAAAVVEHLSYDPVEERYGLDVFTRDKHGVSLDNAVPADRHVLEYVVTDSAVERGFVEALEKASEVEVYAKLPRTFFIPTPMGDYNPDWAIAFRAGSVKHVYFVAETKGTLNSLELRGIEGAKIACAKKFFGSLGDNEVRYDVVDGYERLMDLVK